MLRLNKPLLIAISVIIVLFILSVIKLNRSGKPASVINMEQLERYARLFLAGSVNEKAGKFLDCSGYTKTVYKHFAVKLPSTASKQYTHCTPIPITELAKGDLVFFKTNGKSVSHVGIYLGNEKFIHSPGINKLVRIDSITHSYYKVKLYSGGRIIFTFDDEK